VPPPGTGVGLNPVFDTDIEKTPNELESSGEGDGFGVCFGVGVGVAVGFGVGVGLAARRGCKTPA